MRHLLFLNEYNYIDNSGDGSSYRGELEQKQPPEVFYEKAVLKHSAIYIGKHL